MEHHDIRKYLDILKKGKRARSKGEKNPLDLTALVKNLKQSLFLKSVQQRIKSKVLSPRERQTSHSKSGKEHLFKTLGPEKLSFTMNCHSPSKIEKKGRPYMRLATYAPSSVHHEDNLHQMLMNQTAAHSFDLPELKAPTLVEIRRQNLRISQNENEMSKTKYRLFNSTAQKQQHQNTFYSRELDGSIYKSKQQKIDQCTQIASHIKMNARENNKQLLSRMFNNLSPLKGYKNSKADEDYIDYTGKAIKRVEKKSTQQKLSNRSVPALKKGQLNLMSERMQGSLKDFAGTKKEPVKRGSVKEFMVHKPVKAMAELKSIGEKNEEISGWDYDQED